MTGRGGLHLDRARVERRRRDPFARPQVRRAGDRRGNPPWCPLRRGRRLAKDPGRSPREAPRGRPHRRGDRLGPRAHRARPRRQGARGDGARDHGRDRRQQVRRLRPADARAPGDDHRDAHGDDRDGWLTPATTGPRERLAFVRSSSPPARQPGSVARSLRRASTASRSFATSSIRSRGRPARPVVVIGPEPPVGVDLEGAETVRNWHPGGGSRARCTGGRSRRIGRWSRARPTRSSCSSATSPWSGRRCSEARRRAPGQRSPDRRAAVWGLGRAQPGQGRAGRRRARRSGRRGPRPRPHHRRPPRARPLAGRRRRKSRRRHRGGSRVRGRPRLGRSGPPQSGGSIDSARSPTAGTSTRRSARSSARTPTGQAIRCWRRSWRTLAQTTRGSISGRGPVDMPPLARAVRMVIASTRRPRCSTACAKPWLSTTSTTSRSSRVAGRGRSRSGPRRPRSPPTSP